MDTSVDIPDPFTGQRVALKYNPTLYHGVIVGRVPQFCFGHKCYMVRWDNDKELSGPYAISELQIGSQEENG